MAPHSSTIAWKIPWTEEPDGLQSMGSLRVGHDWDTSLSLFTFMHWRRKWQLTPVFLPEESQGRWSLVGCRLWGCTESDTTQVIWQQQQQNRLSCNHKSKILTFVTPWMVLEGIMLSKISQTEKDKHNMISFICGIQKKKEKKVKFRYTETNWWLPEARSGGRWVSKMCQNDTNF